MSECCAQVQSQSCQTVHPAPPHPQPFFLKSLSVTCCEIPRRRQEEKNQEADICFLCAVKPTSWMQDAVFSLPGKCHHCWDQTPSRWEGENSNHGNNAYWHLWASIAHWHWPIASEMRSLALGKIRPSPDLWYLWKLQNSLPDVSTNITVQVQLCACSCAKIQQACLTPC